MFLGFVFLSETRLATCSEFRLGTMIDLYMLEINNSALNLSPGTLI